MKKTPKLLLITLLLALWNAPLLLAQETPADKDPQEPVAEITDEVLVVTASRTEQRLHDVPASMTVMTQEELEQLPADNYGDLLRNVPGLNVAQMGTRDVQVSSRASTNSLATGQLVLLDGRTLYLDFFGFVIWEFLPMNTGEVKQIEVVRGPGAAVWGANAMNGVINVITKRPREMAGTHLLLGGGELETVSASITHAAVHQDGKLGYKISGSYFSQDEPYDRPSGTVPGTGTPYPDFPNSGTEQPKVDFRLDYDAENNSSFSLSTGWAATGGILHSGIGPFDVDDSSALTYLKGSWAKGALNVTAFVNDLDGEAANLLTVGVDGRPVVLGFESRTFNLDVINSSVIAQKHLLNYGINARQNDYDLNIAPTGQDREEYGAFLQSEFMLGDHVRWLIGGRWDDIDPIGSVFSPRTTLMISPTPSHTIRLSYNEAYRAPSVIENHLDIVFLNAVFLGLPSDPFIFPSLALGNPQLKEEELEAIEIGYVKTFPQGSFSASLYRNEIIDSTDFFTSAFYSADNPPPGWPFPPFVPGPGGVLIPTVPPQTFPALFSYRNIGETINEGVELALDYRFNDHWRLSTNYSYQENPDVTGIPISEVNIPSENRFNISLFYDVDRFYATANYNFVDDAFWTDVLDARFHGPTDSFSQVNVTLGWRASQDRVDFSIIGSNIFDEDAQQHVFGDIISRKVTGEVRFRF